MVSLCVSGGLLCGAVVLVAVYWVHWRWTHRRMLRLAANMPGPRAWPVIGNALLFMTRPEEQLKIIAELFLTYGHYVKLWMGPDLNICVKNPTDVRCLLSSGKINLKGPLYEFMKVFIGPGILSGGTGWRNHRRIVMPSYHKRSMYYYTDVFNEDAQDLAHLLAQKDPEQTFDVYFDVVRCTTMSVCRSLMGVPKDDVWTLRRLEELMLQTRELYTFLYENMTHWWFHIPLVYWLCGRKKFEIQVNQRLDELTSDILQRNRKALKHKTDVEEATKSIVERFLLSEEMTDQEIKWETFTLFTASQEATAKIASTVLLILAHLPEWQDKVYKEIMSVVGPEDDFVTEDHLKQLEYLDCVFKEAIRYMPIGAFIQRTVEEEVAINNGKLCLPVGASVIIPIHMIHRDPQFWDEPDKVQPERFLPENAGKRDPNAYVPFSMGAMDCMGRVFATSLVKTLVVRVLRHVQLSAEGRMEDLEMTLTTGFDSSIKDILSTSKTSYRLLATKPHRHYVTYCKGCG